ncbi:MAG: hypothetical protein ABJF23_21045 [Bryobacteraceae bacterium]
MKFWIAFSFAAVLAAADLPTVTYSKSFPGSVPAYVEITISSDGKAIYKEMPNDPNPILYQMPEEDTKAIFELCDKLEHFKRPLDANLKVAFMGKKTFKFENGAEKSETTFNYSQDEDAKLLLDRFEKVSETQSLYFDLERTIRFDKLGVQKSLLQIEAALDRKRLIGGERFLPLLDRVAKNETYMHMARERAAALADYFRKDKAKVE